MIAITKEESKIIREKFPKVNIVRTMRQRSSRHRYYMEEIPGALKLIGSLRGQTSAVERTDNRGGARPARRNERRR